MLNQQREKTELPTVNALTLMTEKPKKPMIPIQSLKPMTEKKQRN